tara:strand:+ start:19 stop:894 length:876 start_codon:yes stop_codon:yes gene_type:complete
MTTYGYTVNANMFFNISSFLQPNNVELNYFLIKSSDLKSLLNPSERIINDEELYKTKKISENMSSDILKLYKQLNLAINTKDIYKKSELIEYQSKLLFNNRMLNKFLEFHSKYGLSSSKIIQKEQSNRIAITNIILNNLDYAKKHFTQNSENYESQYYLGVISFLEGDKKKALNHFESSNKLNERDKTIFNIFTLKKALGVMSYCDNLKRLKQYWPNTAYNLMYYNCNFYEYNIIPIYKNSEKRDVGGYTNSRGVYVPRYETKKIKVGEKKEKILPKEISFPKTGIFITLE